MPTRMSPTTAPIEREAPPESARTDHEIVPPPREDALRVVHGVLMRALDEPHERRVFETPGVIESLDEALREAAALKQHRSSSP
jgi:hypothetical protein